MTETQKDLDAIRLEMLEMKMKLARILGNLTVQANACRNAQEFQFQNLVVEALDETNKTLEKLVFGK